LVLDKFSLQTVHFLTHGLEGGKSTPPPHDHTTGDEAHPDEAQHWWAQVQPETSHLTVLEPGQLIIFTQSTLPDADRYAAQHKDIELAERKYNRFGEEIMRVYRGKQIAEEAPGGEPESLDA
jgi:hypothetical protein